jgi:hypothetical protein
MNRFKRKKFARTLAALAVPVTTVTLTGHANAACTPAAPVNNTTVTCAGATNNQNDPAGYGTRTENGLTINVESGASVTGTRFGVMVDGNGASNTINNLGTISGLDQGVLASVATVNNSGTIASSGNRGIEAGRITLLNSASGVISAIKGLSATNVTVTNLGSIIATTAGIEASGTINNSGTISATSTFGVALVGSTLDVTNSGLLQGGAAQGIGIDTPSVTLNNLAPGVLTASKFGINAATANVINAGRIESTAADGAAINAATATVTNSGTIVSAGANTRAINTTGDASVTNNTGGTISGRLFGIQAAGTVNVNNAQGALIETTEPTFIADAIRSVGNTTIRNSGTIRSLGLSASGIVSEAGLAITNTSTGVITATRIGTFAFGDTTVSNEGLIEANSSFGFAIVGNGSVNVSNGSGTIRAAGGNNLAIGTGGTATVTNGSGLIQTTGQDSSTISGTDVKITGNTGTIEATGVNGIAIRATETADVTNSGTIQSTGDNGKAIQAGDAIITNNAGGTIVGNSGAIGMDTGTINNAGTISSTKPSTSISTIFATSQATVNNSGTIFIPGSGFGIQVNSGRLDLVNSGTISGVDNGIGVLAAIANVTNRGTINTGSDAIIATAGNIENFGAIVSEDSGISVNTGRVLNAGTVQASGNAIDIDTGTISNSGTISGLAGIHPFTFAMITNSGVIQGIGPTGFGVFANNSANVFNAGAISGNIGIQANGLNGAGTVIANAGTITGTGGTAIKLSPAADTLTLLRGSQIVGLIDMGGGADTININTIVPVSRVSSLITLLPVDTILRNVINFTGTLNATPSAATPGMPAVATATQFATLDPTAFGQADRALMNFTGGISSLLQGRLGGTAMNGSAVQVVSFAPTGTSGRTAEAFAAMSAMGYAAERTRPRGPAFTYADAPYNVWTGGFGGTSTRKGDRTMLRSVASAGAGVIGLDRQVRPDLLIGAFAGGGTGRLSVELNSQSVDTDYVTGGVYGRFDWISHFLDFTLQGGGTINKSKRQVLNDLAPGGSEIATASYDSWYISPEIAYGQRYHLANGYTLTPMGRIRYLAGMFDGYNEAGSAQNLVVGRRTLHDLEERAEVELSKITGIGTGSFRASVHGGLIALQRLGNPTINTVLIGQDLSFTTPGKGSTAGVVAGAGFDLRATDRMSLFGAFEATLMSDHSRTAAAKAGLKFAF